MNVSGYAAGTRVVVHIRRDPIQFMTNQGPKAMPTGTVIGTVVESTDASITVRVIDGESGPLAHAGTYRISGDDVWAIGEPSQVASVPAGARLLT